MAFATTYPSSIHSSSHRSIAMVLSLASAMILSPLYVNSNRDIRSYKSRWSSSFVLPMVLVGLIIAIRTTSSSSSFVSSQRASLLSSHDPSWVLRIGSSSWGLAGVLVMLMLVLYCQASVQELFWR
ncbi:hypothetical protein Lal_00041703 [Lupinus albus]|uniref:Uncharacterized protein n=1 Tax=Lupinus albus TaxID=3870 RepID=A0A6A4NBT7_LUPAL|nr:hypothetical protein Lalb_Chr25g0281471 [Lupinus albus]KAF1866005.1 hypothetical protein Lal_00041703 [Lupinus albus]